MRASLVSLLIHSAAISASSALLSPKRNNRVLWNYSASSELPPQGETQDNDTIMMVSKNSKYIAGLMENLTDACDKWILTGSNGVRERAINILTQIQQSSQDPDLVLQSERLVLRTGMPLGASNGLDRDGTTASPLLGTTNTAERTAQAAARTDWERFRTQNTKEGLSEIVDERARSAFSARLEKQNPTVFPDEPVTKTLQAFQQTAEYRQELQDELKGKASKATQQEQLQQPYDMDAAYKSSQLVAQAGAGRAFLGETLGVGGLDQVLAEVKRRIWVPLAAPPQLLRELGIHPVRGLLLYGKPGCGKTLIARTIGKILSPARPPTVVAGPEIMDKFVGSSEKNLRAIFDNPPDIYDSFRLDQPDGGKALQQAALHVIIMDEFDAMARTRGGRDGAGNQGDAGVARDSVVNQLLAKMDGVDALPVPTLVIGMTNKRSLIEPALLRPGRFEVQIEVPPPKTMEQRKSILRVHTKDMLAAGRLLVRDAPVGTPASRKLALDSLTYEELLTMLAAECEGMSGASLAGVARAAASHALERAVQGFADSVTNGAQGSSIMDCLVTKHDFQLAVQDVVGSSGENDFAEEVDDFKEDDVSSDDVEQEAC